MWFTPPPRGIHCEFQKQCEHTWATDGCFQFIGYFLAATCCEVLDLSPFIVWVLFFFTRWPLKMAMDSNPGLQQSFLEETLFGCPRHIYRNAMKCLSSTCYNMFLHNYLNTIVSQTYVSSLSFPRRLTSFQPFPMDASVAFGGSDFLHWGWWKCLNFVITWGPLRPWTVNKVMSFLPGTLVWENSFLCLCVLIGIVYIYICIMYGWCIGIDFSRWYGFRTFHDISWFIHCFVATKALKEYHTQSTCLED